MLRPWTQPETDALCDAVADGKRFPAVASLVGRSRNACIGKFNRIREQYGWQAA